MWNVNSCNKKFIIFAIITAILVSLLLFHNNIYHDRDSVSHNFMASMSLLLVNNEIDNNANDEKIEGELNENINNILNDIDSGELDDFIENDFNLEFFNFYSFIDLVKNILSNNYFSEYKSLLAGILVFIRDNFKSLFIVFFSIFVVIILNEMFGSFCIDKHNDIKKIVNLVFSLILAVMILVLIKGLMNEIIEVTNKIFNFSKILFPILLSLVLLSGSNGTYTVYTTLSTFLIETGTYIFTYLLFPIVSSIVILTVLNNILSEKRFSKLISFLKSIFKYIIIAFFSIFGLFSVVNIASSGITDGVNYKLTKFAIKTYIPVLGGYISDGFDFVHSCSVLVKNSFGICGILVLFFIILKPLLICFVYILMFKLLSLTISFIGKDKFASYFDSISNGITYFIAIIAGSFMCIFIFIYLLIISVSVIWWYINLLFL